MEPDEYRRLDVQIFLKSLVAGPAGVHISIVLVNGWNGVHISIEVVDPWAGVHISMEPDEYRRRPLVAQNLFLTTDGVQKSIEPDDLLSPGVHCSIKPVVHDVWCLEA